MSELSTTNSQPARTVEAVTLEIQTLQRQAQQLLLGYAIEIGRRLVEVKAMLPHGQWGTYIKEQVGYSQSTANNLMRIFEEYGTAQQSIFGPEAISQAIGNLSYTKALRLLALPADEREAFAQTASPAQKRRDAAWMWLGNTGLLYRGGESLCGRIP